MCMRGLLESPKLFMLHSSGAYPLLWHQAQLLDWMHLQT